MRAIILAGGRGTRLAPLTAVLPKPLMPIGQMPILEVVIRQLAYHGFDEVVISLGYLGELVRAFFAAHKKLASRIKVDFVEEEEPLGTAGALSLVSDFDSTVLMMNGDVLTTLDYAAVVEHHKASGAKMTIATHEKKVKIDLGVLELGEDGAIVGYKEKPEYTMPVSMGVYVLEPSVLEYVKPKTYLDIPTLVLNMLAAGDKVMSYRNEAFWLDIGRHEDFAQAQEVFAARHKEFRIASL